MTKDEVRKKYSDLLGDLYAGLDGSGKPLIWITCPRCAKRYTRQYHQVHNWGKPDFCKTCTRDNFKRRGREFAHAKR